MMTDMKFETVIEITENNYINYRSSKGYDEDVIFLLGKKGEKILLFHNSPLGIPKRSKPYMKYIHEADILVCCYSLFMEDAFRRKTLIKTPLSVETEVFENRGRKFLRIRSKYVGYVPSNLFDNRDEIDLNILLENSKLLLRI